MAKYKIKKNDIILAQSDYSDKARWYSVNKIEDKIIVSLLDNPKKDVLIPSSEVLCVSKKQKNSS